MTARHARTSTPPPHTAQPARPAATPPPAAPPRLTGDEARALITPATYAVSRFTSLAQQWTESGTLTPPDGFTAAQVAAAPHMGRLVESIHAALAACDHLERTGNPDAADVIRQALAEPLTRH